MARQATASRLKPFLGSLAALSVSAPTDSPDKLAPSEALLRIVHAQDGADVSGSPPRQSAALTLTQVTELIARSDWARAQRLLEEAARRDPDTELGSYLTEIRAVRHTLRQLSRRPRNAQHHLELGRLYFGLELGDAALGEFSRAIALEPTLAEAHFYAALEYLFRGEEEACRDCLARASQLRSNMPTFESLSGLLYQGIEE